MRPSGSFMLASLFAFRRMQDPDERTNAPIEEPQRSHPAFRIAKDILMGAGIVLLLVFTAFAISGVWPPFVAVESGSMEPHMSEGDLVFLVQPDRYTGGGDSDGGLITLEDGEDVGHITFGKPGHVVVFRPDDSDRTPIIHRLHLWVEAGENWYDRADEEYIAGNADCEELPSCPAPHAGYVTKGDDNSAYDQVNGQSAIVKPNWIEGRALVRIPYLGYVRLSF